MHKLLAFVVMLVVLVSASAAAQGTTNPRANQLVSVQCPATPGNAKLEVYPLLTGGPMTTSQGTGLGLQSKFLRYPFRGHNHHREINPKCGGTWIPEIIPAGTLVWVDAQGYVAYKHDCGNRLVYNGPVTQEATPPPAPQPAPSPYPRLKVRDFWRNLGQGLKNLFLYGPFMVPVEE